MRARPRSVSPFLLALTLIAGLGGAVLSTAPAAAEIWPTEQAWNADWEAKYQRWLRENAHADVFSRERRADGTANPYYGVRVDCADLVYSLRILFAYENRLPFAIVNPVARNGAPITNALTRFDGVVAGAPRVKRFLGWIHDLVSTRSLARDTYSIAFRAVGPGTIILTSYQNHHSWTISDVSPTGNPTLIFNSTIGRESGLRVQVRKSWPNPSWIFQPETPESDPTREIPVYRPGSYAGFRFWRPAEFLNGPENAVPGFNEEQHRVGLNRWKAAAQTALAQATETVDQIVRRLLEDSCADFAQRLDAIAEAEAYKQRLAADLAAGRTAGESAYVREWLADPERPADSRCMIYRVFDQYSTPSRDRRFVDGLLFARAYYAYGLRQFGAGAFSAESLAIYRELFPHPERSAAEEARQAPPATTAGYCAKRISGQGTLSLAGLKHRFFRGQFSSNPNDSYPARFGYPATGRDRGGACPAFGLGRPRYELDAMEDAMEAEVLATPPAG